jgi:uncharacterized protein YdeI (YjbR/CyaY-like superfamily)
MTGDHLMPQKTFTVTIYREGSAASFRWISIQRRNAEPREVEIPQDLARALRVNKQRMKTWQSLSYTNRRERIEAIEAAKRPARRARRLVATIQSLDDG